MFHIFGDTIVDTYIFGTSNRKSPEADCIVFDEQYKRSYLGGSGNVVANLINLGIPSDKISYHSLLGSDKPIFPAPIIPDSWGEKIKNYLKYNNINDYTQLVKDQKTPEKVRFYLGETNILRHDKEILNKKKSYKRAEWVFYPDDIIIICDYNKGCMSQSLVNYLLQQPVKAIIIDTKSDIDYSTKNKNVWVTPNVEEWTKQVKANINDVPNTLLTKSQNGIELYPENDEVYVSPSKATSVKDVCGAGDTVVASLAIAISNNLSYQQLIEFCNENAAKVINSIGTSGGALLL